MINAHHPERGIHQAFSEKAWQLLGSNKQGWIIQNAKPPAEVAEHIMQNSTSNEKIQGQKQGDREGNGNDGRTGRRPKKR